MLPVFDDGLVQTFAVLICGAVQDTQVTTARLRRVTDPFVLRRLKTDTSIISDLPAKHEMRAWCTLTPEQASLYRATVEEVFTRHGVRLFTDFADDLGIHCTCPDWGHPCKHGAAVLYAWAAAFDDAPLLLFAWLGRAEDEVITALDALGSGSGPGGELGVEVAPLADHVADFWTAGEPARLDPPRPFDPLAHWEGSTPGGRLSAGAHVRADRSREGLTAVVPARLSAPFASVAPHVRPPHR